MANWPQGLLNALAAPGRALGTPEHALGQAVHPFVAAAHFLGGLSHQNNIELQAEILASDLRKRGIPDHIAWPAAHQYATEQNVHLVGQESPAMTALLNQLRQQNMRHRDF